MRKLGALAFGLLPLAVVGAALGIEMRAESGLAKRAWAENQQSETMCQWTRGQSALVNDTILLDGGETIFSGILSNGGAAPFDKAERGVMYALDLKAPFDLGINISLAFRTINKDTTLSKDSYNGALLGNDHQVVLYGGAMADSDLVTYPGKGTTLRYQLYGSGRGTFNGPKFELLNLPDGKVHRYVRRGATVNVPSENLAFYIGGLRNTTWGEIRDGQRMPYAATEFSNRLITADMRNAQIEWLNETMNANDVPLRYDAAATWLPFGKKGSIALIGGITDSADRTPGVRKLSDEATEKAAANSETLIRSVSLYDIDSKKWHTQATTGDFPPPLAGHCAVAVTAEDGSHHIFVYGGRRGYTNLGGFFDTVHVLSLPSFHWTLVAEDGKAGRIYPKCHQVAADKMMVLGGETPGVNTCLPTFIRVFNLNTLQWESSYDPGNKEDKFVVPKKIRDAIGTKSVDVDDDVKELLDTAYGGTIVDRFPFPRANAISPGGTDVPDGNDKDDGSDKDKSGNGGSSIPKYVPPLLGVLLGLFTIAVILCVILFLIRRRKRSKHGAPTETSTVRRSRQTWTWLLGTDEKRGGAPPYYNNSQEDIDYTAAQLDEHRGFFEPPPPTGTTSEMHSEMHSAFVSPATTAQKVGSPHVTASESDSKPLYELEDSFSSPAVELPANPMDQIQEVVGDSPATYPQIIPQSTPHSPVVESPIQRTPGAAASEAGDYMSLGALEKEIGGVGPIPGPSLPHNSDDEGEGRSRR